jgi:3-methyladenine DNA glycosylase AlkD
LGTEQNRKVYNRHGAPDLMFGVSLTNLHSLKRIIKNNHELAIQLWNSEIMDARCLACMIAYPKSFTYDDALQWINDCNYYVLGDFLANYLISKCDFAQRLMEKLVLHEDEFARRIGWKILTNLATTNKMLPDAYFIPFLEKIKIEIHKNKNRAKEAMNDALIAIGKRNANLNVISLTMASEIGKVSVDHGNTACKTPDAYHELRNVAHFNIQLSSASRNFK